MDAGRSKKKRKVGGCFHVSLFLFFPEIFNKCTYGRCKIQLLHLTEPEWFGPDQKWFYSIKLFVVFHLTVFF
jgi:hypothetical protein